MLNRGRKPDGQHLASVTVLPVGPAKPPDTLSEEQGKIWTETVASRPPGWFGKDTAPILESYCIAIARRRFISANIEHQMSLKKPSARKCAELLALEVKQTQVIASLATKMRLTQQSRYTPQAAATASKTVPSAKAPWESDD